MLYLSPVGFVNNLKTENSHSRGIKRLLQRNSLGLAFTWQHQKEVNEYIFLGLLFFVITVKYRPLLIIYKTSTFTSYVHEIDTSR